MSFERFRRQSSGNGGCKVNDFEVACVIGQTVPQATGPAIITHHEGDENSQTFWRMLVSGDPKH
jgi:hypothetical protein